MLHIDFDLRDLVIVQREMTSALVAIQQETINAGTFVRDKWKQAVDGQKLPGMKKAIHDDAYHKAITMVRNNTPQGISILVGPFGYDRAETIERGLPAYDMKPNLLNGPKSRALKNGQGRYNIIPFRHYAPSSTSGGSTAISVRMQMPKSIYDQAKRLVRSVPNATTGKIDWGQSLRVGQMGGINPTSLYQHKTNRYEGMYRVGAEKHAQYLTFRVVSTPRVDSKGRHKGSAPRSWIHPATPPNPIMQAVYNYCMPIVNENMQQLLQQLFT